MNRSTAARARHATAGGAVAPSFFWLAPLAKAAIGAAKGALS
ncbi:MAG: hypothetical protein AAGF23_15525 [Acidobacteriota bacterium]